VKDENGYLVANSKIVNTWKNYFSQIMNVNVVNDVGQMEIHKAEPLVPDTSPSVVQIAIAELKRYTLPGKDHILAELIHVRGETLWSIIHKLCKSIWNKEELPDQ
jgi:hypothetical protein